MKKAIRIGILILVIGLIFGLIFWNLTNKPPITDEIWDQATVIGNIETATRHYVQYSDFACPYCDIFSRATIENEDEFHKFIEEHNIAFEIRLTEMIYDSTGSEMSRDSAVAAYCAKREGRFIDYYHAGVMALYKDYHSKGIGDSKTSPMIKDMPDDYWIKVGEEIGLGDSFVSCTKNQDTLSEVIANTIKAEKKANGLPYFEFGKFTMAGLAYTSWNWEHTLEYLQAGL